MLPATSTQPNQVSFQITESDMQEVKAAITTLKNKLLPVLKTISTEERQTLPKMNEKTVPFVKKVMEYAEEHPEFSPSYLSVPELKKDIEGFEALTKIGKPLDEVAVSLTDTAILAGSEAYIAALSYYNAVKQAVKMNVGPAKVIYDDLKTRFEANGIRAAKKETAAV